MQVSGGTHFGGTACLLALVQPHRGHEAGGAPGDKASTSRLAKPGQAIGNIYP